MCMGWVDIVFVIGQFNEKKLINHSKIEKHIKKKRNR
ncbi:MAG: hypothetical protein XD44_0359 [Methanobacteriaceae archaeon 41_258]|nr:MAG: hypothetical protein XD44_0359 [Methanobacteriaceae archaeon 41_258]